MAVELGPRNIRVIGVCPGAIEDTEGFSRLAKKDSPVLGNVIPLQRGGKTIDVADTCLFVASPAASYITGTIILVDGGINLTAPNFPFLNP
jgi:peroxisomal 2,4-dienoyl-CoA reductase